MTKLGRTGLVMMAALTLGAPAQLWAQGVPPGVTIGIANGVVARTAQAGANPPAAGDSAPATADSGGLSDATKQGIGCLVTSGAAVTYATIWAGATESLMIAAGGLLVPSMSPTLWLGLASTVVAATCALGATATPVVLWAIEQKDNIAANLDWQIRQTGTGVGALFTAPAKPGSRELAEGTR